MKRNFVILLISILSTVHLNGQTSLERVELPELKINDLNLLIVLDSFLISEQLCEYYHDSLYFNIDICNFSWKVDEECQVADTMMIVIHSINLIQYLFISDQIGYFNHKNHLVTVQGLLIPELFSISKNKRIIEYEKIDPEIQITTKHHNTSIWGFYYIDEKLIFESGHPICPRSN